MEDLDNDDSDAPEDNSDMLDDIDFEDPAMTEEPAEDDPDGSEESAELEPEENDFEEPEDDPEEDELEEDPDDEEPVDTDEIEESAVDFGLPKPDKKVFFDIPLMEALSPQRMPPETVGDLMAILRYSNPTDKLLIRSSVGKTVKTVIDVNRKVMVDGPSTTYIDIV